MIVTFRFPEIGGEAASAPSTSADAWALKPIAASCTSGTCPTIYEKDGANLVVQGFAVSSQQAGIDVPDGELLVEIPRALLEEAIRNMK